MNHRNAKDRLLENLPPEQRPYFDRCLHRLSPSPDDPLIALFAILTESNCTHTAVIQAKLAAFEQREKQRDGQHAKDRTEYLKAISQGFGALRGKIPWKHLIASRTIGAAIWTGMVIVLTTYVIDHRIRTVDPNYHEQIATIDAKIDAQTQREEKTQDSLEKVFEITGPVTCHTIVGENLARYITSVDRDGITLTVPDQRKIDGFASFRVPHNMTEAEYKKLNATYVILKQFK